jgi:hypothetical protein
MSADKTILVVLERTGDPAPVLSRAVVLARQMGARLDICLCEAEAAYALQHQFDTATTDRVRRVEPAKGARLDQQAWQSVGAPDVAVNIEVVFEPMFVQCGAAPTDRTRSSWCAASARQRNAPSVSRTDLVRACPALLLTPRRPWRAHPSVRRRWTLSGEEPPQLIHRVLLAARIAQRCGASVRCCLRSVDHRRLAQGRSQTARGGGREAGGPARAQREPARRSPSLRGDAYEILVLGALAHRHAQVGSLTAHLLEALDCDLLLVRPAPPEAA